MDCSKTINFLAEMKRVCALYKNCRTPDESEPCPLYHFCEVHVKHHSAEKLKKAVEILQKWSDEHPRKTYAQDFFKKFPEARPTADGVPRMCRANCYGGSCRQPSPIDSNQEICKCCWDEPMEVIDDK